MAKQTRQPEPGAATERVSRNPSRVQLDRGILSVLEGPDAGRTVAVEGGSLRIGSDPESDLALQDRSVSRNHAVLTKAGGRFLLRDLDSTNGTFVNGNQVCEVYLKEGDLLEFGRCRLRFEARQEEVRVPPSSREQFGPLYGKSLLMRQVFGVLDRVSATDATILVQGETGTGKDLVARAIHEASPRSAGPFVVFDCSAVSPELVLSELFGHEEGAFTGAVKRRRGAFEEASGGTIFLDEIAELPQDVQPKLLRVLESRMVRTLGASQQVPVDIRVCTATHRDLLEMVQKGRFREDLYYRIAVVRVELPPLRQRRDDIPGLVERLLSGIRRPRGPVTCSREAMDVLSAQAWPGNVRELRNVIERTLALASGPQVEARDLLLAPASTSTRPVGGLDFVGRTLEDIEREVIRKTLETTGGSRKETARILGLHRNTLRERMKRHGLGGSDNGDSTD